MRRSLAVLALVAAFGTLAPGAAVAQTTRPELARELARLLVDDTVRRGLDEQVYTSLMQAMSATLQERLSRRLLDVEWGLLSGIVRRFVAQTLPPSRTEEIAALRRGRADRSPALPALGGGTQGLAARSGHRHRDRPGGGRRDPAEPGHPPHGRGAPARVSGAEARVALSAAL
jgi:hypothetical protein